MKYLGYTETIEHTNTNMYSSPLPGYRLWKLRKNKQGLNILNYVSKNRKFSSLEQKIKLKKFEF